ncbi:MAG: hypothetical protein NTX00_05545 [Candidatus Parcubacteria bacterium]|nr:hypothetical protein [Candidatus Parcubacteria bacterium]
MQISYRNIFKIAWQITIKNKVLWIFGIFASLISLESVYEIIYSQIKQLQNLATLSQGLDNLFASQMNYFNSFIYFLDILPHNFSFYLTFVCLLTITLLIFWMIFTSQIYIVKYSADLYKNKKIKAAWLFNQSQEKFWSIFILNILSKLVLYASFLVLNLFLFYSFFHTGLSYIVALYIVFLLLFIILAIIISFLTAYAINFVILKNSHIIEAIQEAWQLFSQNILLSLEISFLLFVLKIISLIIVFCSFSLIFVPCLIIYLHALALGSLLGQVMSMTLIILSFFILYFLISAIYTVFYLSSWTIAFIKMSEETIWGKIQQLVYNIPDLFKKMLKRYNLKLDKEEIKKQTRKLIKIGRKETKVLNKKIIDKYIELKPEIKSQKKKIAKKIKTAYLKLQPQIEKEMKNIIKAKKIKGTTKIRKKSKSKRK